MLFGDITFLFLFLPIFLLVYFVVPERGKNAVLFAFSLIFYGWGSPAYLLLFVNIGILCFVFGFLMNRFARDRRIHAGLYYSALAVQLLLFLVLVLICQNRNLLVGGFLLTKPLGLVFYLFSAISYLTDVYLSRCRRQKNFIDLMIYLIMFPKLLAGPTVAYADFESQLRHHPTSFLTAADGVDLFLRGFIKKALLADNIAGLGATVTALNLQTLPVLTAWLGALAFLFQIYFDFSGYCDMARGLAKMLGFSLPVNFRNPFSARSVRNFFRRYNITVIGWLRCYTCGWIKKSLWYRELLCFLILSVSYALYLGGSSSAFAACVYFLVLLVLEKLGLRRLLKRLPRALQMTLTFLFVLFGAVLVTQDGALAGMRYLLDLFGAGGSLWDATSLYLLATYSVLLVICLLCGNAFFRRFAFRFRRRHEKVYRVLKPILLTAAFLVAFSYNVANPGASFYCIA